VSEEARGGASSTVQASQVQVVDGRHGCACSKLALQSVVGLADQFCGVNWTKSRCVAALQHSVRMPVRMHVGPCPSGRWTCTHLLCFKMRHLSTFTFGK
jgi:hypothetical protein